MTAAESYIPFSLSKCCACGDPPKVFAYGLYWCGPCVLNRCSPEHCEPHVRTPVSRKLRAMMDDEPEAPDRAYYPLSSQQCSGPCHKYRVPYAFSLGSPWCKECWWRR